MGTKQLSQRVTDELRRREFKGFEFNSVARPGGQAVLYCSACKATIPHDRVETGLVQNWPYCPVHKNKALIVRSV